MARTSHARCRRCGAARHKNLPTPYCGKCWQEYEKPRRREHFATMKLRRAEKAARRNPAQHPGVLGGVGEQPGGVFGAIPNRLIDETLQRALEVREIEDQMIRAAADPIAAAIDPLEYAKQVVAETDRADGAASDNEVIKGRSSEMLDNASAEPARADGTPHHGRQRDPGRVKLTPEIRHEIAEAYRIGNTTTEIAAAYEIGQATLYAILRAAGVSLRGRNGVRTPGMPAAPAETPSDIPEAEVESVPTAPTPAVRVISGAAKEGAKHYTVTYTVSRTESMIVYADNVGQAFVEAKRIIESSEGKGSGAEVTSVQRTEDGQ